MAAASKAPTSYMAEKEMQQRDWASGLPSLAVANIAERLTALDFVRFGAACKPWCSVLGKQIQFLPRAPQFPWLMVPTHHTGVDTATRTFISLLEGRRSYNFTSPVLVGKHVVSSDKGWLILCDNQLGLSLLQPITGVHLSLPSIFTLRAFEPVYDPSTGSIVEVCYHPYLPTIFTLEESPFLFINKVVLSCNPSINEADCIAVLLYDKHEVAFARPGDRAWTPIDKIPPKNYCILDILFKDFRTLICLTGSVGNVKKIEFDSGTTEPRTMFLVKNIKEQQLFHMDTCLGICADDIFAVCRFREAAPDPVRNDLKYGMSVTEDVVLYKLDLKNDNDGSCWIETSEIEGYALFIGYNPCICLKAKEVPGVKENCIYFTDDFGDFIAGEGMQATRDVVLFDLKKLDYEFLYPPNIYLTYPPPIWFIPSLI